MMEGYPVSHFEWAFAYEEWQYEQIFGKKKKENDKIDLQLEEK